MQGLKTQESSKFLEYFKFVQEKACEIGCIFFLKNGEGRDFETEAMSGEDLFGWLIPRDKVLAFESPWVDDRDLEKWVNFYSWVIWHNHGASIEFKSF